jgi:hypothetical protein
VLDQPYETALLAAKLRKLLDDKPPPKRRARSRANADSAAAAE